MQHKTRPDIGPSYPCSGNGLAPQDGVHHRVWLNDRAKCSKFPIAVTLATFQSPMGWLKTLAEEKVEASVDTEETSQSPMGWLKTLADSKVEASIDTEETFQSPMGWLKTLA